MAVFEIEPPTVLVGDGGVISSISLGMGSSHHLPSFLWKVMRSSAILMLIFSESPEFVFAPGT